MQQLWSGKELEPLYLGFCASHTEAYVTDIALFRKLVRQDKAGREDLFRLWCLTLQPGERKILEDRIENFCRAFAIPQIHTTFCHYCGATPPKDVQEDRINNPANTPEKRSKCEVRWRKSHCKQAHFVCRCCEFNLEQEVKAPREAIDLEKDFAKKAGLRAKLDVLAQKKPPCFETEKEHYMHLEENHKGSAIW